MIHWDWISNAEYLTVIFPFYIRLPPILKSKIIYIYEVQMSDSTSENVCFLFNVTKKKKFYQNNQKVKSWVANMTKISEFLNFQLSPRIGGPNEFAYYFTPGLQYQDCPHWGWSRGLRNFLDFTTQAKGSNKHKMSTKLYASLMTHFYYIIVMSFVKGKRLKT